MNDIIKAVLDKNNINTNIIKPFASSLKIPITQKIVDDIVKTLQEDINFNYLVKKNNGDVSKINESILKTLSLKFGITNNRYSDKSDETDYVMAIMSNTLDDNSNFSATKSYDSVQQLSSDASNTIQSQQMDFSSQNANSISSVAGASTQSLIQMAKILNLNSLKRNAKAYINTRYQNIINTDPTAISFNLVNKKSSNESSGDLPLGLDIKNIIGFKIPSFTIPLINTLSSSRGLINLSIDEIKNDGFISYSNIVSHFIFRYTEQSPNLYMLTPEFNGEIDLLNTVNINTITFKFSDGFNYIPLPSVTIQVSDIDYTNSYFLFDDEHGLLSGDKIYVSQFKTLNVVQDYTIMAKINSSAGIIIEKIDSNTIQLVGIDLSTIASPDLNNNPTVYLDYRIIQFPLIIKYINDSNF